MNIFIPNHLDLENDNKRDATVEIFYKVFKSPVVEVSNVNIILNAGL